MRVVVWDGGGGGSGRGEAWVTGSVVGGCTGGAGSGMELNSGLRAWVFVSLPCAGPLQDSLTTKF